MMVVAGIYFVVSCMGVSSDEAAASDGVAKMSTRPVAFADAVDRCLGPCGDWATTSVPQGCADSFARVGSRRLVLHMSLPIRRYSRGGILMEGRRSRGHRTESPRDCGTRFTQLRNTCSRIGPTAAYLELSLRFRVVTMSCVRV
jgi:hypothetical protein